MCSGPENLQAAAQNNWRRGLCDVCREAQGTRFTDQQWTCAECRALLLARLRKEVYGAE